MGEKELRNLIARCYKEQDSDVTVTMLDTIKDLGFRYATRFGATIGMDFTIPDEGDTRKALDINAPIGLLIPFNSHVALDLGIRVTYRHDLEDPGISSFLLPIGYFGIDGFF